MAAELNISYQSSWNPLRLSGHGLPPHVLLMAKLIALGLLLKGYVFKLSDHFLPIIPVFDYLGTPQVFEATLQVVFLVCSVMLLLNRRVRTCCVILGLLFLVVTLSSRVSYRNAKVFCGCILFLIGLEGKEETPWLIRLQVALVYFGAGLNKLLDPHWLSGQYFEHWMTVMYPHPVYIQIASWLPDMVFSKFMCWATIVLEFALSAGLLVRRWSYLFVWIGVFFHMGAFILTWNDFGIFMIAILASFLAFVEWPQTIQVFYTPSKALHRWLKRFFSKIDFDGRCQWQVSTDTQRLCVTINGKLAEGFAAFKKLLLYTPVFYFVVAVVLCLPGYDLTWIRIRVVEFFILFFFPYELGYRWVSLRRTRH